MMSPVQGANHSQPMTASEMTTHNATPAAILGVRSENVLGKKSKYVHKFGGLNMVHTCVVAGCRNRRTPGTTLSFYRFPRDPQRKQRWIAAVNREGWVPNEGSRLCSTHFISGMCKLDVMGIAWLWFQQDHLKNNAHIWVECIYF